MTQDHHPEQLTADELAIFRADALLDAILDGRPGRSRTTCGSCSPAPSASTGEPATHPPRPQRPAGSPPSWSWATPSLRPCTWTRYGAMTPPRTPEEVTPPHPAVRTATATNPSAPARVPRRTVMSETDRVTLVGNLTADPELRSTPTGLQVANLRLAVTPRTRQEDGSWTQGETSFHTIVVWRDQATNAIETPDQGRSGDRGRPAQGAHLDRPRRHHPRGHRGRRRGGRALAVLGHRHPDPHQRPQAERPAQ